MGKIYDPEKMEAVDFVYCTNDYSMFRKLEENRGVARDRVNKLVASFSAKEILNPIVVNEKFEIIDGQGRYEALKILNKPIRYVVEKGANIEDCRRMNRYNKSWSNNDWIDSFCLNPDETIAGNYKRAKECMTENKISYTRMLSLAKRGSGYTSGGGTNVLTEGKLIFTEKDAETVRLCVKNGSEIADALLIESRKINDKFWTAVKVMTLEYEGLYDHEWMLRKCKYHRGDFILCGSLEAQLKEFSRIYNDGIRKTGKIERLYFEDYMRNKGHNVREYSLGGAVTRPMDDVSTLIGA